MSGMTSNLQVGIDGSLAKTGAAEFKAQLTSMKQATQDFEKATTASFKKVNDAATKSIDSRAIVNAVNSINNLRINSSLINGLNNLGAALKSFKAPNATVTSELNAFNRALGRLTLPNVNLSRLDSLSNTFRNFRAPSQTQSANLRNFITTINSLNINNNNLDQVVNALNRVAAAAANARNAVAGLNGQLANVRVPRVGGGGSGGLGRGGSGRTGGGTAVSGRYDGALSGSDRATGELRGFENLGNASFQGASILRTMIPAITSGALIGGLFEEGGKFMQYQHVLEVVTQDQAQLNDLMKTGDEIAQKYGLNLDQTREGFSHLAVNMKMAGFTIGETKQFFQDITGSMLALGTDATRQEQVWRGINAVLANGKVMSTQLTRQFDTALPGFKELMAQITFMEKHKLQVFDPKDIGKAGVELTDELRKGEVSREALIKTFQLLLEKVEQGIPSALKKTTVAAEQFKTTWKLLMDQMGNQGGIWLTMTTQINRVTEALKRPDVREFFMRMAEGINKALVMMGDAAMWAFNHLYELSAAMKAFVIISSVGAIERLVVAFLNLATNARLAVASMGGLLPAVRAFNTAGNVGGIGIAASLTNWTLLAAKITAATAAVILYEQWNEKLGNGNTVGEQTGAAFGAAADTAAKYWHDAAQSIINDLNAVRDHQIQNTAQLAAEGTDTVARIWLAFNVGLAFITKQIFDLPKNISIVATLTYAAFMQGVEDIKNAIKEIAKGVVVTFTPFWDELKRVFDYIHQNAVIPISVFFSSNSVKLPNGMELGGNGTTTTQGKGTGFFSGVGNLASAFPGAITGLFNSPPQPENPVVTGRLLGSGGSFTQNNTDAYTAALRAHEIALRASRSQADENAFLNNPIPTGPINPATRVTGNALQPGTGKAGKDKVQTALDEMEKGLSDGIGIIQKFLLQKKALDDALAGGKLSLSAKAEGLTTAQMYARDLKGLQDKLFETIGAVSPMTKALKEQEQEYNKLQAGVKLYALTSGQLGITQEKATEIMKAWNAEHLKQLDPVGSIIKGLQEENASYIVLGHQREVYLELLKAQDALRKATGDEDAKLSQQQISALTREMELRKQLIQYEKDQHVGLQEWANSFSDLYTELGKVEQKMGSLLTNNLTEKIMDPEKFRKNGGFAPMIKQLETDVVHDFVQEGIRGAGQLTGLLGPNGTSAEGSVLGGLFKNLTGIDLGNIIGHKPPMAQKTIGQIMDANGGALPVVLKGQNGKSPLDTLTGGGKSPVGQLLGIPGSGDSNRTGNESGGGGSGGNNDNQSGWGIIGNGINKLFGGSGTGGLFGGTKIGGWMSDVNNAIQDWGARGGLIGKTFGDGGWLSSTPSIGDGSGGFSDAAFSALDFSEGGFPDSGSFHSTPAKSAWFKGAPSYADGTNNVSGGGIPVIAHPNEAVIPLSRGRKVPVEMGNGNNGGYGGGNTHVTMNITTPDHDSFRNSEAQIAQKMGNALRMQMMRHNGQ